MSPRAASVITVPAMPSEQDAEIARRFTVTYHYLLHLSIFLRNTYGAGDDVYSGIAGALSGHRPYLKLQRRTQPVNLDRLRRHLEIAWVGEIELRLPESVGGGVAYRYSNAWAPVHAYYATYMLLQAWFDANGITAHDHMATLRTISTQIRDRSLLPAPWSVLADGNALGGACTYLGEPSPGACSAKTEVLAIPIGLPGAYVESEFWARYGTWLRTTREKALEKREGEWKQNNGRTRMDPKVRIQIASVTPPTSLFDCLWRLRIRSNYRSVETYLSRLLPDHDTEASTIRR